MDNASTFDNGAPGAKFAGPDRELWAKIVEADRRIRAIEVVWRRTTVHEPQPAASFAPQSKSAGDLRRSRGLTQFDAEGLTARIRKGYTVASTVRILSDGQTVRDEVVSNAISDPDARCRNIDLFDGTNNIHLWAAGNSEPSAGSLDRKHERHLGYSAPGPIRPLLYFASPLTNEFRPETTRIAETAYETIVLEHMLPYEPPLLGKLTLSKSHWRPIRLTTENPTKGRVNTTYKLNGYREYEGGIHFPSEIRETATGETGRVMWTDVLTLESVRFNEHVDTSGLYPPVQAGVQIGDFRFGDDRGVTYRVGERIPSDATVRRLLRRQRYGTRLPAVLCGVAVAAIGAALYRRARRLRKDGRG